MLSTVVLPAPFGPIIEKTWPASTSRFTFVTAWTPPNDFETSRISTCALIPQRGPPPRSEAGGSAPEASGLPTLHPARTDASSAGSAGATLSGGEASEGGAAPLRVLTTATACGGGSA